MSKRKCTNMKDIEPEIITKCEAGKTRREIRDISVFRSGYYAYVQRLGQPEHDADLIDLIRECQRRRNRTYDCKCTNTKTC